MSLALVDGNLSDADGSAQSMPDASPAKWHWGHTTWFFETFVLRNLVRGYRPFDDRARFLFNSYYEAEGARIARAARGLLTRPTLGEIRSYRLYVDDAVKRALVTMPAVVHQLIELGCHHEEQHQELLLTDILHLFAQNPLAPAVFRTSSSSSGVATASPLRWIEGRHGAVEIGHTGRAFAFDCEGPRHTTWLAPHALADRLVTNGEWRAFMDDGGYTTANLWLFDGWAWVRENAIDAPLYWRRDASGAWTYQFGLDGLSAIDPAAPVQHVSFFEADAFARWAGARLPTEAEWEGAAERFDACAGTFLDGAQAVRALPARGDSGLQQLFGDAWEWTASAFLAYPGFRPAPGAIGVRAANADAFKR